MPHSLRARLSGLRYKKIISDKDYDRLCKALDNEGVLDKIRAEIEQLTIIKGGDDYVRKMAELFSLKMKVLQIIDKYKESKDADSN